MDKEQKFVSVVAYMRNTGDGAAVFLDTVMGACSAMFEKCELVLIDDCSDDGSAEAVREYCRTHSTPYMVSILKTSCPQGLESSMNAGRDIAIGDYVYEFDDMFVDYPADVIEKAYRKCLEGCDIVSVMSDAKQHATSKWFYNLFNLANRTREKIGPSTLRLLSRRAINRVKSMGTYIPYRKAVYVNSGLSVAQIVYHSTLKDSRFTVHSHRGERAGLAVDSFIYFTDVMEKFSLVLSFVFFGLVLAVIVYIFVSLFTDKNLISGWVSTMGFLSLGFLGVFALLTIVLRYLSVLVNLVFRQKRYLVESVEKISGD